MKQKINLTLEKELVNKTKRFARSKGTSVSKLVESLLREAVDEHRKPFSERWLGKLKVAEKDTPRFKKLADRYL